MNKILFVCLLSLSLCFSAPTEEKVGTTTIDANPKPTPTAAAPPPSEAAGSTTTIHPELTSVPTHPTEASSTAVAPSKDKNANKTNKKDAATEINTPSSTSSTLAPVTEKEEPTKPKEDPTKPKEDPTKPTSTTVAPTTTVASTNATSTTAKVDPKPEASTEQGASTIRPTPEPKADKIVQARGFDGPSFIGGIVLTLGLLATGFIGLKYYKNHTERNYHTL